MEILYRDEYFVALFKPPGIHTHPTALSLYERSFLQNAQDSFGQKLYPVHRLDRAASGILILALNPESAAKMGQLFREHTMKKTYHLLLRGWVKKQTVDRPLLEPDTLVRKDAVTEFIPLDYFRVPMAFPPYPEIRLTWVMAQPKSGRRHQIRLHAKAIKHPVIGDIKHGDLKLGTFLEPILGIRRLWLMATSLEFIHPYTQENLNLQSVLGQEEIRALETLRAWKISPDPEEIT